MKVAALFHSASLARRPMAVLLMGLATLALLTAIGLGLRGSSPQSSHRDRSEALGAARRKESMALVAPTARAPVAERAIATDEATVANNDASNAATRGVFETAEASITRQIITTGQMTIEADDVAAATQLGSLKPEQIGSHADTLHVTVNDMNGFTVSSGANGWLAVFGKYGLSQRTTALIPGEVQLLTALLVGREDTIQTVFLSDERNGTYLPKPSARASPSSKP